MLTENEKDIILHALGNSHKESKLGWRNYYCTEKGDPELEALVEKGFMKRSSLINEGRDQYYVVTDEGKEEVGVKK